jgi:hypothetical protein
MNDALGPCPCCRRHVRLTEHRCPFCGKAWLLSAAAAAALLLGGREASPAPIPDLPSVAADQEQEYGVPRVVKKVEWAWVWDRVTDSWKSQVGFTASSKSWAGRRPGTTVTYNVATVTNAIDTETFVLTYRLTGVDETHASIAVSGSNRIGDKRQIALKAGLPEEAKSADQGKETIDVAGKKVECTVKSHEWPGRELRTWTNADGAVVKIVSGEEISRLVKSEEITVAGKAMACSVWETKVGDTTVTEWRSETVPGLIAQWEEVTLNPDKPKGPPASKRTVVVTSIVEGR